VRKAGNLPPSCAVVTKSSNLNFLEPSGPAQACNGTDLSYIYMYMCVCVFVVRERERDKISQTQLVHILFIYKL